jgi:isopentenyldiphosphate isomerase
MAELFDVVDEDDGVVGTASREECHHRRLLHRSVMFFIFDGQDRILVNRRSASKEFFGGLWSIVLGGHLASGEGYLEAVVREAREEAQIGAEPFRMGYFKKRMPEEQENVTVFGFKADKEPELLADEIAEGRFMTLPEAEKMIKKGNFIPETRQLMPILRDYLSARH